MTIRNWSPTLINQAIVPGGGGLLDLATFYHLTKLNAYLAAGWTMVGSTNGTLPAPDGTPILDGVNRLTTLADFATFGANGTPHWQYVLRSPPGNILGGHFVYRWEAGDTVNPWESEKARTSQLPTGGDRKNDVSFGVRTVGPLLTQNFYHTFAVNHKVHAIASTFGDVIMGMSQDGSNRCALVDYDCFTGNTLAADNFPFACFTNFVDSARGGFAMGYTQGGGNLGMFWIDGTLCTAVCEVGYKNLLGQDATDFPTPGQGSAGAGWPNLPVFFQSLGGGQYDFKGNLIDVNKGAGIIQMRAYPLSPAVPVFGQMGDYIVPTNGGVFAY